MMATVMPVTLCTMACNHHRYRAQVRVSACVAERGTGGSDQHPWLYTFCRQAASDALSLAEGIPVWYVNVVSMFNVAAQAHFL